MYADHEGSRYHYARPIPPFVPRVKHGGLREALTRFSYSVLLQEEAINKMKRKTETTEDPVEVNYVSKKVKQSSDKCS